MFCNVVSTMRRLLQVLFFTGLDMKGSHFLLCGLTALGRIISEFPEDAKSELTQLYELWFAHLADSIPHDCLFRH